MPTTTKSKEARERAKTRKYVASDGRPVMFPKAESYSDLFDQPSGKKEIVAVMTDRGINMRTGRQQAEKMGISNYVAVDTKISEPSRYSLYARPKKVVVEALEKTLILVNYDEIYFEIVIRSKGDALVVAKHNQILGSRYVAVIDPKTVPRSSE